VASAFSRVRRFAMFNLADLHLASGRIEEAETWFRRAADAGDVDAMFQLGSLFQMAGRIDEAQQWLQRASVAGHSGARNNLILLATERNQNQK
jgi:TPR repeat protein